MQYKSKWVHAVVGVGLCLSGFSGSVLAAEVKAPEAPAPYEGTQKFGIRTPMRDGVELVSDMWMPDDGAKYPVILIRTPYEKTQPFGQYPEYAHYFVKNGYAFVVQDVRGRGDSVGNFGFFFQEAEDGYDTVEWIAKQPWSDGRVCMMGVSYLGTVQWLAAKETPPHLKCIAPTSPGGKFMDELPYSGGAFMMSWALFWLNDTSGHDGQGANSLTINWDKVFQHRPLLTMDEAMGRKMPMYRDFLTHSTLDDYWKRILLSREDFSKINIPILNITGAFDGDQTGTLYNWDGISEYSKAKKDQYLIFGPWTHVESYLGGSDKVGNVVLPENSVINNKKVHLDFFDRYLKETKDTLDMPRVQVYVTGRNEWQYFDEYPVKSAKNQKLYFGTGGALGKETSKQSVPDTYVYDPQSPVPLDLMKPLFGMDRADVQKRDDVLVYSTEVLDTPVQIIGKVLVDLYAATDAKDTDFTAAISEVYPDGKAVLLGAKPIGIIRARYKDGLEQEKLITPNKIEHYTIDLGYFAHEFQPGNKIRIEISSSAYPMFNPNQNTGNPVATDTEWKIANQTIFHNAQYPSALILPVIEE
ncbi:CocE/NonD family hydrolase [Kordiimonas pumila]|uniref:CocE/NonD family hydrolase n=1 Tax=Kordiimonas pumila TaxID=2161677 RepID=A0ABV7D185_9PROT|nr:CocE/NonD family hydrolase [Kordiimonas pumila]